MSVEAPARAASCNPFIVIWIKSAASTSLPFVDKDGSSTSSSIIASSHRRRNHYAICGQAMKAVRWADPRRKFLQRLRRQEENSQKAGQQTRFIIGGSPVLDDWLTTAEIM